MKCRTCCMKICLSTKLDAKPLDRSWNAGPKVIVACGYPTDIQLSYDVTKLEEPV